MVLVPVFGETGMAVYQAMAKAMSAHIDQVIEAKRSLPDQIPDWFPSLKAMMGNVWLHIDSPRGYEPGRGNYVLLTKAIRATSGRVIKHRETIDKQLRAFTEAIQFLHEHSPMGRNQLRTLTRFRECLEYLSTNANISD